MLSSKPSVVCRLASATSRVAARQRRCASSVRLVSAPSSVASSASRLPSPFRHRRLRFLSATDATAAHVAENRRTKDPARTETVLPRSDSENTEPASVGTSLSGLYSAADEASSRLHSHASPKPSDLITVLAMWSRLSEIGAGHASVRGIPQRAEHLLSWYEATQPALIPGPQQTEAVNHILRAWAYSREHLRATMAEQIFQHRLPRPNIESYRLIVRAWCLSDERRRAFKATNHFMRMMKAVERSADTRIGTDHLTANNNSIDDNDNDNDNNNNNNNNDSIPTLDDYHMLCEAWSHAEDRHAPSKVAMVLEIIETAFRKGHTPIRPDKQCYRDALVTMSRRSNAPEVGELIDKVLTVMKDRLIVPDNACYSAAIRGWKNVARSVDCPDRDAAGMRAFSLLQEMTQAHYRTTEEDIKPMTVEYNNVLQAISAMQHKPRRTVTKALMLLDTMEIAMDSLNDNEFDDNHLYPNGRSYKLIFDVLRTSSSPAKLSQATAAMDRLKQRCEKLLSIPSIDRDAIIEAFSAFIQLVAITPSDGDEDASLKKNMEFFRIATNAVTDMRRLGLQPNSLIYNSLLTACAKLLPQGRNRQMLTERIFRTCCEEGYVDQDVMKTMQDNTSSHTYAKLIIARSEVVEDKKVVPESWTRNVKGFFARAKSGRKILPLTIDGNFAYTKAEAEHRMTRLRKKTNKKILQGGRL